MKDKKNSSSFSIGARQKIFASLGLAILAGGYVSLFFIPGLPNGLWMRLLLAFVFAILAGVCFFFLLKKRLSAEDIAYIKDEENFARAMRALKQTRFYTKKLPGFPNGVRREIFPAAGAAAGLCVLLCLASPCRPPKAPLPDFSEMAALEFYYPNLFAASDSLVLLAPPILPAETKNWTEKIPADDPEFPEYLVYSEMFQNHFHAAYASGNLSTEQTPELLLATAQAALLSGQYPQAVDAYEKLQSAGDQNPAAAFQKAIALAYSGELKEAEKAMNALKSKEIADAIGDEFALAHWKTVLDILQGEVSEDTLTDYRKLNDRQSSALKKFAQKNTPNSENANPAKENGDGLAASVSRKKALLERRLRTTTNNLAVVQILFGDFANAVPTANAVLSLTGSETVRTQKIFRMCVLNTKGYAAGFLGKAMDDQAKKWDETAVFDSASGYFGETRKLYEEILALSRLETESVDPAYRKAPCFLLPWCSEMRFALTNDFTSSDCPSAKAFRENFAELLETCTGLHKIWNANELARVPVWAVPVENLLMRECLILEGEDTDENFLLACRLCDEKLEKKESLALLETQTLKKELQLVGRFAPKEGLTIGMLDKLQSEQKKLNETAKDVLPEFHPMLGRQEIIALRLALMQKKLTRDDLASVNTAMKRANTIFGELKYPEDCVFARDLEAAQRLVNAMRKKEIADIQAIFDPAIEKCSGNLFQQSFIYRDLGFALLHRDFIAEGDAANRSARTIFNQQIFRDNTHHFLILQMDKILKH